jgi:excisionase family DNA binding protein
MLNAAEQISRPKTLEEYPDILTPDQVAEIMQCTTQHIYNLIYGKKIRAVKFGRLVRIHKDDVLRMFRR